MTVSRTVGEKERMVPTRTRVVHGLDEEPWARFVRRHPEGSIFHTPEMHRVWLQTRRHRPSVWAVLDDAGEIRALWTPVEIATVGGPLRLLTSRAVSFAGPLASAGPEAPRTMNELLSAYQERASRTSLFTEIRNHATPALSGTVPSATGFHHERHLNFLIDLTLTEDDLWERVAPSARRNVRKARRMGVTIDEVTDPVDVATGYELLRDVYHRIRVPLPHRSLFDASLEILGPLGWFKFLIARVEGRPIGALTLLLYKDLVYYWYTGTLREYAGHRAGDLLVWHAISSSRADGYRTFDFGGAGRPEEAYGVRDFKAKYGGQLIDLGRDVWWSSPLRLRVSKAGYSIARRFL
jgi:serine/alanine adding enzyme